MDNAIFKIPHAASAGPSSGTGTLVFADSHLRGPIALALAPNGDLLTSNSDAINPDPAHPSEIVEFTKTGHFIGEYNVHQNQGGAFGIPSSISDEGAGHPANDIALLAVMNDNASDVAVTAFVLPQPLGSNATKWPDFRIRRRWENRVPRRDRPDSIAGRAGADFRAGPE